WAARPAHCSTTALSEPHANAVRNLLRRPMVGAPLLAVAARRFPVGEEGVRGLRWFLTVDDALRSLRPVACSDLQKFERLVTTVLKPVEEAAWSDHPFVPAELGVDGVSGAVEPDSTGQDHPKRIDAGVKVQLVLAFAGLDDLHDSANDITSAQVEDLF